MTRVLNSPQSFRQDMMEGLLAAYGRYLEALPNMGGVKRLGSPRPGKVSVVVGGGSGHYPAFAGFVGQGLADGAVMGDVFASPSAEQVYQATRALDGGAGVLFSYGNYSGDAMNFGLAEQRAQAEGIDVRTVRVTDDIASAPPERARERRGIAGGLCVFKIAGAAAERGERIDEVERVAKKAVEATHTLGVAFEGCTLPGNDRPLFVVDQHLMEVGLGIHGEPGVRSSERLPAAALAELFVTELLADERPSWARDSVAVVLNGLGGTKYEELFVLYKDISSLLASAGLRVVSPEVGEMVTSLDMAGCSLTLFWLDDELAQLWEAPAESPAYRKPGNRPSLRKDRSFPEGGGSHAKPDQPAVATSALGTPDPQAAAVVLQALGCIRDKLVSVENELGKLDAVAGDGDHGRGMARGARAAVRAAEGAGAVPGQLLVAAGAAWAVAAGGASGALWGAMLGSLGRVLLEKGTGAEAIGQGLEEALGAVVRLGGAKLGDKTMVDALEPFVNAYLRAHKAGASLADAWSLAVAAGEKGANGTADLVSKRGRAAVLGERSRGSPDPGAVSLVYCVRVVGEVLTSSGQDPKAVVPEDAS